MTAMVFLIDDESWTGDVRLWEGCTRRDVDGNVDGNGHAFGLGWGWSTEGTPVSDIRITYSGRSQSLLGRLSARGFVARRRGIRRAASRLL